MTPGVQIWTPTCTACLHWKRMHGARGQCWHSSHAIVPQRRDATDTCASFTDQLANRDAWHEARRP